MQANKMHQTNAPDLYVFPVGKCGDYQEMTYNKNICFLHYCVFLKIDILVQLELHWVEAISNEEKNNVF